MQEGNCKSSQPHTRIRVAGTLTSFLVLASWYTTVYIRNPYDCTTSLTPKNRPSVPPSVHSLVCLSEGQAVRGSVRPPVYLSFCSSVYPSVQLSVIPTRLPRDDYNPSVSTYPLLSPPPSSTSDLFRSIVPMGVVSMAGLLTPTARCPTDEEMFEISPLDTDEETLERLSCSFSSRRKSSFADVSPPPSLSSSSS